MSSDLGVDFIFENDETWDLLNLEINSAGELGQDGEKLQLDSSTTPSSEMAMAPSREKEPSDEEEEKKKKMKNKEKGKREVSEQEKVHIFTERERRKKMRTMFTNLHALLPQLPPKADKSTIVDEAVSYIKSLEHTLQNLEKQKQERLKGVPLRNYDVSKMIFPTKGVMDTREAFVANHVSANPSVSSFNLTSAPATPQFSPSSQSWCSKGLILNVSGLDAQICVCSNKKSSLFTGICLVLEKYKLEIISAQVSSDNARNMYMIHTHACCPDLLQTIPVEEIYKQAVREINFYYNLE